MSDAAAVLGLTRQALYTRVKVGTLAPGMSPLEIVKAEIARKRQEIATIERRLAAFTGDDKSAIGSGLTGG